MLAILICILLTLLSRMMARQLLNAVPFQSIQLWQNNFIYHVRYSFRLNPSERITAAIQKFGAENSRGIAVVDNNVSDNELERLHRGGVRGLRFSVWNPKNAVVSFDDCYPLSERTKHFGWNMQLHMSASQLVENADIIRKINCKIVIDHMGRLDPALGTKDIAYSFIRELIDKGHTWVKLSGPYLNTLSERDWSDATKTAQEIAAYAPERVVWGSDWPHVTEKVKPDEFVLTEMIADWIPSENARKLALSDNPAELYGFSTK